MSERDELVQIIWDDAAADRVKAGKDLRSVPVVLAKVEIMADKILAAGYRKPHTITTTEELDALLTESVVRSRGGIVWEKYPDEDDLTFWMSPGSQRATSPRTISLPATVLYEPQP